MARVFVTGSADGLGRAAAETLLEAGHDVVVHIRSRDRLTAVDDPVARGAAVVVGDLSDPEQTRGIASEVNRLGALDAVIHNAGETRVTRGFFFRDSAGALQTTSCDRFSNRGSAPVAVGRRASGQSARV